MIKNTEHNNRVVIAEDSQTQAEKLKFSLKNLGLDVYHAINGKEALNLIGEIDPVMIISDIMMPEMDGYELVGCVRSKKEWNHIPFILLTSLFDMKDVLHGLESGADSYIMKPFNEHYLQSRLNQVMENRDLLALREVQEPIELVHFSEKFLIRSNSTQILNLLFSSYESAIYRNIEMEEREKELMVLNRNLNKEVEQRIFDLRVELDQMIQAEKQLKISEEKFKGLFDNAYVGLFLMNENGEISLSNHAFEELLDREVEEIPLSTCFYDMFEDPNEVDRLKEQLKNTNNITGYESRIFTKTRQCKDVLMNMNSIGDMISGMVLDITDKKRAESQLKKTRNELILEKEKAEESETLKNSFIANMSNEILNPLNSLVGFTKLIASEGLSPENLQEYTDQININGNNLVNIIENIIDVAKVESGELVIKKDICKINAMLLDLYADLQQQMFDTGKLDLSINVKREVKDSDFVLYTEPYRLKRILKNLLGNALKYTDKGSIVFGYEVLGLEDEGKEEHIRFFVRDTGKGMPEEKLQNLFDRFNQTEVSYRKKFDGAGLGLPLSKAYVELLGGKIWCESVEGKGTTFYFTIPLQHGESSHETKVQVPAVKLSLKDNRLKILVAEDNASNYYLLEALLDELEPTLIWARNGKEAIEFLQEDPGIDLVLMDLQMPVMSGQDAIREIRRTGNTIPIIAQTAYIGEEDRVDILDLGCSSFLTKPLMREALLNEIGKLFSST